MNYDLFDVLVLLTIASLNKKCVSGPDFYIVYIICNFIIMILLDILLNIILLSFEDNDMCYDDACFVDF